MDDRRVPFELPDNFEPAEPVVPRDSSTVIVLRDGAAAVEVFMLERQLQQWIMHICIEARGDQ